MTKKIKSLLQKTVFYKAYLFFIKHFRLFFAFSYLPFLYKRRSGQPVEKNKAVFIEVSHPSLSNNLKSLHDSLEKDSYKIEVHLLLSTNGLKREQRKRLKALVLSMATAHYVFITEGTDLLSGLKVRPETVFSQVWHGCGAFKKFGLACSEGLFGASEEYMKKHPFYSGYTNVFVSSENVCWAYEQAMGYSHTSNVVKPLGVSRTDVFFNSDFINKAKEKLKETIPQSKNKKVILYAPTFRGHTADAVSPDFLDYRKAAEALSGDYILLVKHHPHVKKPPVIPQECRDFAFDVTKTLDIDTLLCIRDICISDYSSLIFEFSLFERPMIFFAPDRNDYIDWRGFFYDYSDFTPGDIANTTEELIASVKKLEDGFDKAQVKAFKGKFMSACDGHSTERILNCVMKEGI